MGAASAIVETGRFRRAAERLYLAQPSISQQIRGLEEELGSPLFIRSKSRQIELTEAGTLLKDRADAILRQCQLAKMEIGDLSSEPSGTIRIGIGGHQLTSMLPPALSALRRRFPNICLDIVNGTTPQLIEMIAATRLDMCIVNFPLSTNALDTRVLFTEELVLVVRKTDPEARRKSISPQDIGLLPLVLFDRTTSTRKRLDDFFQRYKISPIVVVELNSVESMKRMVDAGMGATLIPASALLPPSERKTLRGLRIEGSPLTRQVGMALPRLSRMPRVIDTAVAMIEESFAKIAAQLPRQRLF